MEAAHSLARQGGRIGFLVPSGLYSDHGTGDLRSLFLERCRWEWLFCIENGAKIFPIHRSYKFNPVVIEKDGSTNAIRTAFMRRKLEDWERAEDLATPYTRAQIERFSPKTRAILEIQSGADLDILEKIYANSVLLGDDGPDGWGIKYATEFHMTGDSKLFPPRPEWEEKGYRPDEYSRWLKGDWRPIGELWAELDVDPDHPVLAEIELEDWLFDTTAGSERCDAEAQFVRGHLLKPGDVARTDFEVRCARPPYDRLPVPRVAIPPGIILSRDGTEWVQEGAGIEDVALPLYEGRMIGQFDFSEKGWVSGKGRSAVWREIPWERKQIEPQYLMSREDYYERVDDPWRPKLAHMNIGSATNARTAIGTFLVGLPAGHSAPTLTLKGVRQALNATAVFESFAFDFVMRSRVTGLHLDYHVLEQNPLPRFSDPIMRSGAIYRVAKALCLGTHCFAPVMSEPRVGDSDTIPQQQIGITVSERLRLRAILDAAIAVMFGLDYTDLQRVLEQCDLPVAEIVRRSLNAKGFWRIDKDRDPELRQTVLTLIAYLDLHDRIKARNGDREDGIQLFMTQNHGEGWLLPEAVRLADYDLGHDDRARHHQPVASRLGPRFYDWQLVQSPEESWREYHLHARNLLGRVEYVRVLENLIEHRVRSGGQHHDLLFGQFTRSLVGEDAELPTPTTDGIAIRDGGALRAAEPEPDYSTDPSAKRPQTEMFRGPQAELFE